MMTIFPDLSISIRAICTPAAVTALTALVTSCCLNAEGGRAIPLTSHNPKRLVVRLGEPPRKASNARRGARVAQHHERRRHEVVALLVHTPVLAMVEAEFLKPVVEVPEDLEPARLHPNQSVLDAGLDAHTPV